MTKITPIYKKDDPHLLKNYRPISVLPAISKLLEKFVYYRFYPFLSKFNILSNCQYGFRRNHSTSHAVTDLEDKIISAITLNKHAIGIYMDLSKAFDIVDHTIILFKLEYYGVRGTPLLWFKITYPIESNIHLSIIVLQIIPLLPISYHKVPF